MCSRPEEPIDKNHGNQLLLRMATALLIAGLATGIALRVRELAANRSLWLDPAMLALNVICKGYGELVGRLDMSHAAPPAFLLISKVIGSLAGYSETSLRVLPFAAGIAALGVFFWACRAVLERWSVALAFVPLAMSSTAVFCSAEFKQYSVDLLAASGLLLATLKALERRGDMTWVALWLALSIVSPWFSYASVFVVAGAALVLSLEAFARHEKRIRAITLTVVCIVLLQLAVLWLPHIRATIAPAVFDAHVTSFAPLVPTTTTQWLWWWRAVTGYAAYPLGVGPVAAVPLVAIAVGCAAIVRERRQPFQWAAIALVPLIVVVASGLRLYPITTGTHEVNSRFVLFTAPFALLLMARGVVRVATMGTVGPPLAALAGILIVAASVIQGLGGPRFAPQEMRPAVAYLREHLEDGDAVYVFHASVPAFR